MIVKPRPDIDYAVQLNEEQYRVVTGAEGPCLVLAGAGSGKTRVLVYRVAYLLERGVPPSAILLLAFTNRAAKEMIGRVEKIAGSYPAGLRAGTFHHAANMLLKRYGDEIGVPSNYTILDEEDALSVLKGITGVIDDDEFPAPAKVREIISLASNTVNNIKDIVDARFPQYSRYIHRFESIAAEYHKRKRNVGGLDYDDLLLSWLKLMKNETVGAMIAGQFQYVLVDEYHDTNRLQASILYQIVRQHKNLLAVGDDAQSIYSFRGATVNNILDFSKVYPDTKIFYLKTNYRSTPEVLSLANNVISHNRAQFPKKLASVRAGGVKPVAVRCSDVKDEAFFTAQRIHQLVSSGISPSDIGVLFRSRYQAAEVEIELNRLKVPYIIRGGVRFFEQAHVKDMLAYFRVVENFRDEISWRRIFALNDGVGKKTLDRLVELLAASADFADFASRVKEAKLLGRAEESVRTLLALLQRVSGAKDFSEGVDNVLDGGYRRQIEKRFSDDETRLEDIGMLKEISHTYANLHDFLSEAALQEHFRNEPSAMEKPVVLSTIHQAKGLEWRIVFVIGVCGNHFPHPASAADIAALEEERRIFYVAVTRAKEDLYLTYYMRDFYRRFPYRMSLFIEEADDSLFEQWNVE